jgi:large subunit ribosomal protein L9
MATKLLLIEDVEDLGRSGDVVSVRPGYARNFLLPRGVAVPANTQALKMQARLQDERLKQAAEDKKEAEQHAVAITGVTVTTIVKVDQEGHMYGSVSSADIVDLLQQQASIGVDKRSVQLKHPIKELGVHTIELKLKEGVLSSFTLKILSEEAAAAEQQL